MDATLDPTEAAEFVSTRAAAITTNVAKALQGKDDVVHLALVALLANGHVLVEDVPGVGKTLLAKSMADSLGCTWKRIQFTPDLLPSDLIGVNVFNPQSQEFTFRPGALFANILLADEVNRASPKTQSALLESMEERQVTVEGRTYRLKPPFVVIATQNPLEHEGTYPLPESQLDRFLLRISIGYPSRSAAMAMLDVHSAESGHDVKLEAVTGPEEVVSLMETTASCYVAPQIKEYVLDIAEASRKDPDIELGASPRACIHVLRAAKAAAVLGGRHYVVPDDVKAIAHPVLDHRIVIGPEAELRGVTVGAALQRVIERVPVPVRS